jgi:hypothetical protein
MQMNDIGGTGTLVQVIHILRNDGNIKVPLKGCNKPMTLVRFHGEQFTTALVIELQDKFRICGIPLGGSDNFYGILVPKATTATKSAEPTLYTHSCTRQDYNLLHNIILL